MWNDGFYCREVPENGKWELYEIGNGAFTIREVANSPYEFQYSGLSPDANDPETSFYNCTPLQHKILKLMVQGLSVKEAAYQIGHNVPRAQRSIGYLRQITGCPKQKNDMLIKYYKKYLETLDAQ